MHRLHHHINPDEPARKGEKLSFLLHLLEYYITMRTVCQLFFRDFIKFFIPLSF